jgi:hypothetical protein
MGLREASIRNALPPLERGAKLENKRPASIMDAGLFIFRGVSCDY